MLVGSQTQLLREEGADVVYDVSGAVSDSELRISSRSRCKTRCGGPVLLTRSDGESIVSVGVAMLLRKSIQCAGMLRWGYELMRTGVAGPKG